MIEEKLTPANPHLVRHMVEAFGYEEESAIKVVDEVIASQKATRLEQLEEYLNRVVLVEVGELHIEAVVTDVKIVGGLIQYQVRPMAGDKHTWVHRFIKVIR